MTQFPNVLAAVEIREKHLVEGDGKDLWSVADALIKDCGSDDPDRRRSGAHNGSDGRISACAKMLEAKGYKYSPQTLREIRDTGVIFSKSYRRAGVSLWVHKEAGSPDFLDALIEKYGKGRRGGLGISVPEIRELHRKAAQAAQRSREIRAAKKKAEAEAKLQTTIDPAERERLKDEINANRPMPVPKLVKGDRPEHPLRAMLDTLGVSLNTMKVAKLLRDDLAVLQELGQLHPDYGDAMVEEYEQLITLATQCISAIRGDKKAGLAVVEGGKYA